MHWRGHSVASAVFTLFVGGGKTLCANVTVQRQQLYPLVLVADPPEAPFPVLTPIAGLVGLCTAVQPCNSAATLARHERLCAEWDQLHGTQHQARRRPRVRFFSRHTPAENSEHSAREPSIATVAISTARGTRSYELPSDLVFVPTLVPEARCDTNQDLTTKAATMFVHHNRTFS